MTKTFNRANAQLNAALATLTDNPGTVIDSSRPTIPAKPHKVGASKAVKAKRKRAMRARKLNRRK